MPSALTTFRSSPWPASHFLNIAGAESSFDKCVKHIKSSDFIAFNVAFLDVIGPDAKLETIHTFSGADAKHVHEAPIYLPDTNEVLVSDTAIAGWMHAVNLDTHAVSIPNPPFPPPSILPH